MSIRFYQEGDEQQIQSLFTKVFGKDRTLKEWSWKFKDKPQDDNPWILVFEEEGKILGHISLWVSNAFLNGQEIKVGLRIDTMVDPDARGKGIYKSLNTTMIEEAKKSDIHYLYGFPAPKAKELLIASTNAEAVADISRYMLVLNPVNLASAIAKPFGVLKFLGNAYKRRITNKSKISLPSGWKLESVKEFDDNYTNLTNQLSQFKQTMLKRDKQFLNWRYISHPQNDYIVRALKEGNNLLGFIVLKKEIKPYKNGEVIIGSIVDWLAIDEEKAWRTLLMDAMDTLIDTDIIQTWSFPNNIASNTLVSFGFKEKDKPMSLVVNPVLGDWETLKNKGNWWVTQGDIDSF